MEGRDGEAAVECYAGYRYPERPLAFDWAGVKRRVREVEQEWSEPGLRIFVVRDEAGERFRLSYSETASRWRVRPLRPGDSGDYSGLGS
jgi:hypothetical protein